jgi:hypothetical protein
MGSWIGREPTMLASRARFVFFSCAVCVMAVPSGVPAQSAPDDRNILLQMVGTWDVQQRMWPGVGGEAVTLPPAVARRRMVGGAFLEEVMELPPGSKQDPFTRIAFFNYNAVNQQHEYFSLDTRAPQMMSEKSFESGGIRSEDGIILFGGSFVAPKWGEVTNAAFRYRLRIGRLEKDRQVVQLYLTPLSGKSAKEFLAFEYVYTRQR